MNSYPVVANPTNDRDLWIVSRMVLIIETKIVVLMDDNFTDDIAVIHT